jgi:hypothetical protein
MSVVFTRIPVRAGELFLGLQDVGPATDQQWAPLIEGLRSARASLTGSGQVCALVISDGGAPNAGQRADLARTLEGIPFKCGVLSDSTLVRGAVTAMSWFNSGMKSFSPRDSQLWLAYAPLDESEIPVVRRAIAELYKKLKVTTLQNVPFLNMAL